VKEFFVNRQCSMKLQRKLYVLLFIPLCMCVVGKRLIGKRLIVPC